MFGNLTNFESLGTALFDAGMRIIPALICITFHELAHGYTAYRLGDRTAKEMGRLTLNPIKHIDIFGLIMMMLFRFGWAKPVPVNMNNFKKPKFHMAVTAFAGPLSNLILALVVMFIYGLAISLLGGIYAGEVVITGNAIIADGALLPDSAVSNKEIIFADGIVHDNGQLFAKNVIFAGGIGSIILQIIHNTVYISFALAVFNLLPIPPLDGSKVLFSLLSEDSYYKLMRYERYGMIVLIIFLSTPFFSTTIGGLTRVLFSGSFSVLKASYWMVS